MIAEALKLLLEQGKSLAPQYVKIPGEPDHCGYLLQNGEMNDIECRPHPRRHQAADLESLCAYARDRTHRDFRPSVWYSRTGIVLVIDDSTRRDVVEFKLTPSPQLDYLRATSKLGAVALAQKALVLLLRTTFFDCAPPDLLNIIRAVRWNVGSTGEQTVGHGKSSVGKQLLAEIQGADAIPEYVRFTIPMWTGYRAPSQEIVCALEPDPETQTFRLIPLPLAVENATLRAEDDLQTCLLERLAGDADETCVDIYRGTP